MSTLVSSSSLFVWSNNRRNNHNNMIRRDFRALPNMLILLLSMILVVVVPQFTRQPSNLFGSDAFQLSSSSSITQNPFKGRIKTLSDVTSSGTVISTTIATTRRMHRQGRTRGRTTYLKQEQQSSSTAANDKRPVNGSSSSSSYKTKISKKIPFIIERIPNNPSSALYQEIAQMCITAFFNTDNNNSSPSAQQLSNPKANIPIWKEWQLAYLRTLQAGDLERRRKREPQKNRMFLARQVVLANQSSKRQKQKRPLVLDTSLIRNFDPLTMAMDDDYMYGDIIGFVEVTQRPYGLGEEGVMVERYVLTNLSVDLRARQSGIGSALVQVCEQTVYDEYCQEYNPNGSSPNGWNNNNNNGSTRPAAKNNLVVIPDMVLEVEDDNVNAIDFYRKRDYVDVCVDPTSRRYDLSGLWLQQIRCKRLVMKKDLRTVSTSRAIVVNMENTMTLGLQALQRFRDNLLNVQ